VGLASNASPQYSRSERATNYHIDNHDNYEHSTSHVVQNAPNDNGLHAFLSKAIASALAKQASTDPNLLASELTKALGAGTSNGAIKKSLASTAIIPTTVGKTDQANLFTRAITTTSNELAPNMIKLLEAGFKTYIPLSSCTHKACRLASRSVEAFDSEISMNEKGEIKLKHKALNAALDHQMTTDDFSQVRENLIPAIRKHLILAGETAKGAPSAIACAEMFATFFTNIATRPDWTEDWMVYRGYLIDTYSSWISRSDNSFGMFFTEQAYAKYQLKTLVPNIQNIVRHQLDNPNDNGSRPSYAYDTSNRGMKGISSASRGRSRGTRYNGTRATGSYQSHSFRDSTRPSGPLRCFLCGDAHFHKDHQGKAKRLVLENGNWVDKALGGRTVCISFNSSPYGCQRTNCYFNHSCSLCGSPEHGASKCPT
jgi:hypothetical protein